MGIRRRRRKLTSLMSRLDQRVRAVELRPISLLTTGQINDAVELGTPATGPETVVSASAPYQFRKVQDAYVYPKGLIGKSTDRVEIYLETDLGVEAGDRIEVSGIHWASSSAVDVHGDDFTVESVDTPPWTGRASYMHDPTDDQLSGVTISHAYYFEPETAAPTSWSSRRRLQTRRKVDSYSITGTTVTLTMNADHHFEVGDVIFVDIFSESSAAYGADGLFYVTVETSNTMQYELSAGVDTPTGTIDVSADDIYVFPVAREWAQDGSIWVDSSNNETYYWNGIRWVDYTPGAVPGDGDPPSAPTSFTASSEINFPSGSIARVEVDLSWTAPTTSESGDPLTDLAGYLIKWRAGSSGDWKTYSLDDATATSFVFGEVGTFATGTTYNFELYAKDSGGEISSAATASTTTPSTPATNITTIRPVEPTITSYMGVITLEWDGTVENTSNVIQTVPDGLQFLQIHRSVTSGFTPSSSTVVSQVAPVAGQKYVDANVTYGNSYYYKLVLIDGAAAESLPSEEVTGQTASTVDVQEIANIIDAANITAGTIVTGEDIIGLNITGNVIKGNEIHGNVIKTNTLEADRIVAGAITAKIVAGDVITTNLADSGSRVRLTTSGLEGYNGSTRTFYLNANDGSLQINGYATDGELSSGLSGKISTGGAASDINSNTTTINGGKITTGTLLANAIGSGTFPVGVVYAGDISATQVTAGTFTGSSFRTAASDRRVLISSSSNSIKFYDDGDSDTSQRGTIIGTLSQMRMYGPSNNIFQTMSSTTYQLSVNSGTLITANSTSFVLQSGGSSALDIGSSYSLLRSPSSSTQIYMDSSTIFFDGVVSASDPAYIFQGSTDTFRVEDLGGTTASTISAFASGTLYRGTGSDERLKENIADISNALGIINASRPVTFTYKADAGFGVGTHYGLIAQELAALLPEGNTVISTTKIEGEDDTDYYTIEYQRLIPILMGAVKELSSQVQDLTTRIEALET